MDAQFLEFDLITVEDGLRQAEIWNAVAHHAAQLIHFFKHGNVISSLGQLDRYRDPRRSAADYRDMLSFGWFMFHDDFVEIRIGDIVFNAGNLYRGTFPSLNAMSFALGFMVADQRANYAHRVIGKEHGAGIVNVSFQEKPDHLRNIRLGRAALEAAERLLALQTAPGFIDYMYCHGKSPVSF